MQWQRSGDNAIVSAVLNFRFIGRGAGKIKIQTHHINYKDDPDGEWTVELPWFLHRPLNILQRWKPTTERYVLVTNFLHAVQKEWSRIRRELDQDK